MELGLGVAHHLSSRGTSRREAIQRETGKVMERRTRQVLERSYLAEDNTRQAGLETACRGLYPSTGHWLHNVDEKDDDVNIIVKMDTCDSNVHQSLFIVDSCDCT